MTEYTMVERPIIEELVSLGWKYVDSNEAMRKRGNKEDEMLLLDELKDAIRRINANINMDDDAVEDVVRQLKNIPANIDGIEKFLYYFKHGMTVQLKDEGNKEKVIRLFDLSNIESNRFTVTNQFRVEGINMNRRLDILLFVNGIPLVSIECKDIKVGQDEHNEVYSAYDDIKIYEQDIPDLYKFVQICIATDGEHALYFANAFKARGEDDLKEWKDPYPMVRDDKYKHKGSRLMVTIDGILARHNLLDIIANFTFIRNEKSVKSKVTARYIQFRAANKIYNRAIEWIKGGDKRFGLIWHWQGSGKTYTMAFSAWKLYHALEAENPSIFVVVDRKNLEEQIESEFKALSIPIEKVESVKHLREVLEWGGKGKRGIFLVTIEKFQASEFKDVERVRIERRNVIALVDEAHRTQYAILASMMRSIFADAAIFGFTGTPLSKNDRNTFAKFSPRDEPYLDRYSMLDALNDGMTVSIFYQARLPEYHKNQEILDELASLEEEFNYELDEEERKRLRRKMNEKRTIIASDERIDAIANDIVAHFKDVVEPTGMKAMIVAYDRHTCIKYKRALDRYIDDGSYSEVVISFSSKERDSLIRDYVNELINKYGISEQKIMHENIVDAFKYKDKPKILIVTDMLITGFDAPLLWCMYIDKPLREHRLLQTLARTNRPYKNKEFGLVVDYIGILDDIEKALDIFEGKDLEDLRLIIRDVGEKFKEFKNLLGEMLEIFNSIKRDDSRDSIEKALDVLIDTDEAKIFEDKMKVLMKKYEWVKGNADVAPLINDYRWLCKVYAHYNARYKRSYIDELKIEEYSNKTKELMEQSIRVDKIRNEYPILSVEDIIREVKDDRVGSDRLSIGKAIDMLASIHRMVRDDPNKNSPFVIRLRENIEEIYEELRNRRLSLEELIDRLREITNDIIAKEEVERSIGGKEIYAIYERIYSVLRSSSMDVNEEEIKDLSRQIWDGIKDRLVGNWKEAVSIKREIRRSVRLVVIGRLKNSYNQAIINRVVDGVFDAISSIR
ncbi:MAG: HsdR family type I site-specific deoxyribonuclease [Candidatus Nitrosocaldus sp.]